MSACSAQDLRYLSHQAWSTEQGLPQSSVHSITQTSDGYLWVATEQGLARFDGLGFQIFSHNSDPAFLSDDICCLAEDGAGGLWIGTADGLLRMQQGRFRRYGVADGLLSSRIVSIATRGGSLVVDTAAGLAQWAPPLFRALSGASSAETGEPISGPGGAVWSYDRTSVSVSLRGARRGWIADTDLHAGRIQTLYVDREGLAWVGTNNGLFVVSANDSERAPKRAGAIGGNSVLSIFEDAEGDHWIGTETSGLHVLRPSIFRGEPALADEAVTSVAQTNDGSIWVGTRDDGLRRERNGVVDQPVAARELTSTVILCLAAAADGGLWVGTPDGLNYIAGNTAGKQTVRQITSANGLPDDFIRSLAAGTDGSMWAGTQHGLAHIEGSKLTVLTSADGLGGDVIGTLLLAAGETPNRPAELWAGTSGGLSRVRETGEITRFTTKDGLPGEIVTAMAQADGGGLWIASRDGGLSLFDGQRFLPTNAFAGDASIDGIRIDKAGFMWLRMERGISRISVAALHTCVNRGRCADGAVAHYGLADGLPNDEVVAGGSPAAWLAADGELWFATRGGVAIADTGHLPPESGTTPVVLQRLLADDISEDLSNVPLGIPFGHSRLTMEYAGLGYRAPSEVRYRVWLEGFDKYWVEVGGRRSVSYTNLPPRGYRFRVQASDGDGRWSEAGLSFRILPPFYRRWWFVALLALIVMACLAGLYLLRLRILRRQFDAVLAERNRMAREIHDTLTQDFVGASVQLDIIAQQLSRGKVEMAIDQVRRTRQLVTDGLAEARQSIWELRANKSQDPLPARIGRLIQRDAYTAIAPKLHVGGAYRPLEPRIEREVLRILQEALLNTVRHAGTAQASVTLHYSSDTLKLVIEDDGVGFAGDAASGNGGTGHYGLVGMKERASTIDAVLEVASEPGQGTRITLRVPMAAAVRPDAVR